MNLCSISIGVNHNPSKAPNHTEANPVKGKSVVGEIPGIPLQGLSFVALIYPLFLSFNSITILILSYTPRTTTTLP